ncbi:MAG: alpha-amylase family glycosyl hydrolase [Candidatus Paceibacterota bacterium]
MAEERIRSISELDFSVAKTVHPSPEDWRDHVIYFLLVDRFDNGKRNPPYDGSMGDRNRDARLGDQIHGGTIKGIKRRLKYLKNLGVTTLWLSPIFKNRAERGSIHGYAIQDFLSVDPHFGTLEEFKDLVDSAHKLDMRIVLDIVINHTADNWGYENDMYPAFDQNGTRFPFGYWRSKHSLPEEFDGDDAVWPLELQDPDCYSRRGVITDWNNEEQSKQGDFFVLKDLDLNNPKVLETMVAIHKYWIAETDIDGYRIDTVKHVDTNAIVVFFNSIKEYAESIGKKNFLLFGEIVGDDAAITKYVGHQNPNGDRIQALDAALDFPLYFVLDEVLKGTKSMSQLRDRYTSAQQTYLHSDGSDCLVTFLDNHDQTSRQFYRFLYGSQDKQLAILGVGYLLTTPGIPAIYYGTEQGFDGGGDMRMPFQDNQIRECMFGGDWGAFGTSGMHFFDTENPLYKEISKIAEVRAEEPALRYGRFYFRDVSEDGQHFWYPDGGNGLLAFSRIHDSDEVLVVINIRDHAEANYITIDNEITPPGTLLVDALNKKNTLLTLSQGGRTSALVTMPPMSISIFKRAKEKK